MRVAGVRTRRSGEEGFLLIGALVAVFLVLLVLSVAAPTVARQLRREREVEAVHRGNQYVRAIQMYYKKTGHYPGSVEQLEKTNNIRYLRQKYVDPSTGKADWRIIHLGEQKTTIKGFFGQPLTGVATSGIGSSIGGGPATVGGNTAAPSAFGTSGSSGSTFGQSGSTGSSAFGSTLGSTGGSSGSSGGLSSGSTSTGGAATVADSSSGSSGVSSQSATSFTGSGAPIVGFGSSAAGTSMVVLNEQTTYPTWEFIYDPRIEALKAKVNILGGGMATTSGSAFGGSSLSSPSSTNPNNPAGPISGTTTPSPTTPPQ